jgi:type II restriction/modification system DNA methylase subunit YeeA
MAASRGRRILVCYWFQKASEQIAAEKIDRAGLVATNSIRGGANREVLKHVRESGIIFDAWDDEPWVLNGAAVRVSLVSFARADSELPIRLDARQVLEIFPDLTARTGGSGVDLTKAKRLPQNCGVAFMGDTKGGAFDIEGDIAREWLALPLNPNGKRNSDVLKPWINGLDVTRRPRDMWIVDFGWEMSEEEAALYEKPFTHVREHVFRSARRTAERTTRSSGGGMSSRDLASRRHRLAAAILSDSARGQASAVGLRLAADAARQPDHCRRPRRRHDLRHPALALPRAVVPAHGHLAGGSPRYTPTTCFETFPFPEGLTPDIPAAQYAGDARAKAIAAAAASLNEKRENWLNPQDLIRHVPGVVPGCPDRLLPVDENAATILKKRTLTNLYNERPAFLEHVHRDLDAAVAAAYGWPADLSDEQVLERLFKLNQARAVG